MNSIKLQEWALGAEIIGALAVVISLGVVAYQLDQSNVQQELNTNALEITAYQDLVRSFSDLQSHIVGDGEFSELLVRGRSPSSELSESERSRIISYYGMVIRHGDMAYFQYERGTITEDQLDSMLAYVFNSFENNPLARGLWANIGDVLNPNYVAYVNERLQL